MSQESTIFPQHLCTRILGQEWRGVIEVDRAGCICFWSPGLLEAWGIPSESMIGKDLLAHPVFAHPTFTRLFDVTSRNCQPQPFLLNPPHTATTDQSAHHGVLYPVSDDAGQYDGMAVAFLRTRPQQESALPDALFRQCFNGSNDSVAITDMSGTILEVNDAFVRLYGYSRDDAIGQNHRILRDEDGDPALYQDMWRDILNPQIGYWKGEIRNRGKDGSLVDVLLSITPIRNTAGHIEGYMGISIDLSQQKRLETQLRLSEEKYSSIIRNAHEGIAIREGMRLIEANEAFAQLVGAAPDECVGMDMRSLLNEKSRLDAATLARAERGEVISPVFEIWVTTRRGEQRLWRVHESRLSYREHTVALMVQDITEDRLQAERLIQQEKLAAIGLLTAGVAHEVGNPLSSLSSLAQVWAMEPVDEETRKRLEEINRHIRRISGVVTQMLEFARPRDLEWQRCDIHQVIEDAIQFTSYDRRLQDITVERHFAEDLPATYAMAEGLRQVFVNLMINAVDAMQAGGVLIIRTALTDHRVRIIFEDTGEGMTEEVRRRAFEPFFTTKDVGKGTGMGLAVSYSLIQRHNGTITIDSREGVGTTVEVAIPHREQPVEEPI